MKNTPSKKPSFRRASVQARAFGQTSQGEDVELYVLSNCSGATVEISNYGGTAVRLLVPDRHNRLADVVLGFDALDDYLRATAYFGCLIGRCANRIADGAFELDGRRFVLAKNNAPGGRPCHLHGGEKGFDKVVWRATPLVDGDDVGLLLSHLSSDGDEGYPGNLQVDVRYWWTADNALKIEYCAVTDKPTPVNLTHHAYFNLNDEASGSVGDHMLTIHATHFTPTDAGLIPTGELAAVAETPFDFTVPHRIGARIDADHPQLHFAGGYDHNWILQKEPGALALAATVLAPQSGRSMQIWTTEPGLQFYSGNFLDGTLRGKSGTRYPHRSGFCLETQHFPDAPNHPHFPNVILSPGKVFKSTTIYQFSTHDAEHASFRSAEN